MSDDTFEHGGDQLVIGGLQGPRSNRRWWIGGGALGLLAIGGGAAAWAAASFFSQGSQPADALPDSTVGYVSIDLDPSGGQKIAALQLARKFPALKDKIGPQADDDIRKWLFDEVADASGCTLDFDKDVAPWLGSRGAVAAVGTDKPVPVVVVQANDTDKVKAGVDKLRSCDDSGGQDSFGWTMEGDWVVFARTTDQAEQVVKQTAKGSLADDPDFKSWTQKAGDSGILTAYAAPAAGQVLAEQLAEHLGGADGGHGSLSTPIDPLGMLGACRGLGDPGASTQRLQAQLADFGGAAATLRFGDDGLELEMAGDTRAFGGSAIAGKPAATPVITTLPADTAVAIGFSLQKGWTSTLTQSLQRACGGDADPKALFAPLAAATGLDLPGDLEKLFGDSAALALGPGLDVERLVNSGDISGLPLALKVRGDKATIDRVSAKLRQSLRPPAGVLEPVGSDGAVAIGLDRGYAAEVAAPGRLGSSDAFTGVVPDGDRASSVLFVNVDALDHAIKAMSGGDQEVAENLAPLQALGLSGWTEDGDAHALLRISVD